MITVTKETVQIDTASSTLLIGTVGTPELLYMGKRIAAPTGIAHLSTDEGRGHGSIDDTTYTCDLYSFTGDGNHKECALILSGARGELCHRFLFTGACEVVAETPPDKPHARQKEAAVCFTYECAHAQLTLRQYIATCREADTFIFWTELDNRGEEDIYIRRMMSLQLDIFTSKETVYTFDGAWSRERHKHAHPLAGGVFYTDSKWATSSNLHNPLTVTESEAYGCMAINLIYGGNHKTLFEQGEMGKTRILCGINDYNFNYLLKGGDTFTAPEAVLAIGADADDTTRMMHTFVHTNITPPQFRGVERPVLINNWEATYFDFDQKKLLDIADRACEMGVELFVLDDGWFGGRVDDRQGLGDWVDNRAKTGGLADLKAKINARGMKFGLWIEPEMIQTDSDLYRAHPEFAMHIPGVPPIEKRMQLMIDMANDQAVAYLIGALTALIDEVQPDYIKWDYNRCITDAYSPALAHMGDFFHRYLQGVYRLFYALTSRYPHILFEGCSGGGNRFDLATLYFTPQIWCSDDTDARERVYIQEGTLYGYPQACMGSHVSIIPNHGTLNSTSPSDRFNLACIGAFGYELDLCRVDGYELALYKEQIAYYKQHRRLLQFGTYYRLKDIFTHSDGGWIAVSEDRSEAIAMVVETERHPNTAGGRFRFKGLDPDKTYRVTMRVQDRDETVPSFTAGGDLLMAGQICLGRITNEANRHLYSNSISSRLLYFCEI